MIPLAYQYYFNLGKKSSPLLEIFAVYIHRAISSMRILLTFIAFLPPIIATPAFPASQVAGPGTNSITAPKNSFNPFGDQPFGDQPFGDQPFGVWPWNPEEPDHLTAPTNLINLPLPQDSGDPGIYAPPTEPWGCPSDRPIPLCCDGKPYGEDVQTGCSACASSIPKLFPPPDSDLLKSLISRGGQGMGNFSNVT